MFCKNVPIMPIISRNTHLRLGRGRSRDISMKITRNTDIEAEPEQASFMIIRSRSPESVIMEMTVSPCVIGMKKLAMLYAIHVENCAYDIPTYASTSLGKAIPKPKIERRIAGREATSPKKTKASPAQASSNRNISNSGPFAGIKNDIIYIIIPLIIKLIELYAR